MLDRVRFLSILALCLLVSGCGIPVLQQHGAGPTGQIERMSLESDGRSRGYLIYTPARLRPGASLILAFHASQSSGSGMRAAIGRTLERIADRDNAVVVYPDGFEGHFNDCRRAAGYSARTLAVDDVGFTARIIERLAHTHGIDPQKVLAIGFSNGGQMALRLALERPDLVRGVGVFAANRPADSNLACVAAPRPARLVVFVAGTEDPINPYTGGRVSLFGFGDRGQVLSAQASAERFANALGLKATDPEIVLQDAGITAQQQDWVGTGGQVRLVTLDGGGHTVPQSGYRFSPFLGATLRSDTVLESLWQLFVAQWTASPKEDRTL